MNDEQRVNRVARALCVADGYDPEEMIYVTGGAVEVDGTDYHREIMAPAWHSYDAEARRFVAAMVALEVLR